MKVARCYWGLAKAAAGRMRIHGVGLGSIDGYKGQSLLDAQ